MSMCLPYKIYIISNCLLYDEAIKRAGLYGRRTKHRYTHLWKCIVDVQLKFDGLNFAENIQFPF